MTDTNYNDGKWHGWNGGECPVHPETLVDIVDEEGETFSDHKAGAADWERCDMFVPIIAFRVTKEHKEPREWLIAVNARGGVVDSDAADSVFFKANYPDAIHVREVIGDDA
jgi:hypothetical protein